MADAGGNAVTRRVCPPDHSVAVDRLIEHVEHLQVQPAFGPIVGASANAPQPNAPERRYALGRIVERGSPRSPQPAIRSPAPLYAPLSRGLSVLTCGHLCAAG